MDFSRLHMYTPPQCVPENTGYTYALSSSYSSDALAFETEHRLDPVFDSPRMSRRSLRLVTTACATEDGQARDTHSCASSTASLKDRAARTVKQRRSASKPAFSINHTSRKVVSCGVGQSGTSTLSSAACLRPPVLDESLIREQTKVDHFWGLDDDGDLKGGNKAATQGNGDLAAEAARSNGYTCSDCLLLSERKDTLTAHSATHGPSPRLYSRDQGQKRHLLVQMLQRIGASGWSVSKTLLCVLWLAMVAPGKAASGIFWWLGIGWYQFVTLISWLNVFLLTRCLRNICKFLILLIPLLLLLGGGLSLWGQGDFLSGLPVFNWTRIYGTQRVDSPESMFTPDASQLSQDGEAFHEHRMSEVERQMTSLSGQCHSHEEKLRELATVLQTLQARVDQMDGDGEATLSLVQRVVGQHLKEISADGLSDSQTDTVTFRQEHELRLSNLEDILGKLTQTSEAIQKELEQTKLRTASGAEEEQRLLSVVKHLEEELGHLKSELSSWQHLKTSCEEVDTIHGKVDAQVRETVKLMFSDGEQGGSLKWLLQTVSSQFVSRDDLQVLLRDLELQILKNITHYISVTKQVPDSETVVSAANEAGISGITEAQARVIVNNALKLYSQDKTGMVDFALESGGGSILSTRCSETYETKTALISLFGIPLWYFSQSPRVVIQPDIHPGNCWAFRGSQGYLVVRLSMKIRPTAFTLEHIPKTLSPTGNITSAPKDFAVYGLEDEYQEEGQLLGQFTYDQEGESLQMFHVPKRPEGAFQIVELRIFSNWGHPEYTCLYRFRVHGEPIK
ncbi:SUN domain-containing protein 1 isoform X8 [Canis lupus familiaris]|uniref:Sad1 and UNC84 domain containing 1 n=1 Tax=Canis lupus familiaris TaxID=9615 RepID=A0A8P0P466_CANLF|nr:SUN domain-containing protein 1 isoform X8 [Canis lupus familiaris]|eukprot:XP_005621273.1 SUN domain-containing protein 1 isoform X9 [Canis lupus familiaris]